MDDLALIDQQVRREVYDAGMRRVPAQDGRDGGKAGNRGGAGARALERGLPGVCLCCNHRPVRF